MALAAPPASSPQATPVQKLTSGLPSGRPLGPGEAGRHPHKRWSLVAWVKSFHRTEPVASALPPSGDVPDDLPDQCSHDHRPGRSETLLPARAEPAVLPAPQAVPQPASAQAPAKTCFSWVGKGPVTGFFRKLKSLGKGCGCCVPPLLRPRRRDAGPGSLRRRLRHGPLRVGRDPRGELPRPARSGRRASHPSAHWNPNRATSRRGTGPRARRGRGPRRTGGARSSSWSATSGCCSITSFWSQRSSGLR